MPSLVSDFIITPVLRQARRFSSSFAADEPPRLQRQRAESLGATAAVESPTPEGEEAGRGAGGNAPSGPSDVAVTHDRAEPAPPPDRPVASVSSSPGREGLRTILENAATTGPNPDADSETTQARQPQPSSPEPATDGTGPAADRAAWPLLEGARKSPLPEDDGMGDLRRRIQAIQSMDVSQHAKAQMMHQLLMEKYTKSQQPSRSARGAAGPESPSGRSVRDSSEPSEPTGPLQALRFWNHHGDGSLNLPLTEDDLKPTYAPSSPLAEGAAEWVPAHERPDGAEPDERPLGCEHYRRNVKLQCACCERWYTCRLCHDAVEDHVLPRQQTKHMLCMLCGCAQRASDTCVRCGRSAAHYYCNICKLWNDDPNKSIYHCPECGLCRVGQGLGKDFFHCKVSGRPHLSLSLSRDPTETDGRTARNAWPASPSRARTSASSGRPTATAPSAATTCSTRPSRSCSCSAGTASTGTASRST